MSRASLLSKNCKSQLRTTATSQTDVCFHFCMSLSCNLNKKVDDLFCQHPHWAEISLYTNSFLAFSQKLVVFPDPAQASREGKQIEGIHGVYTVCWCRCLQTVNVWAWKPSGVSLWHYMKCSARPLCACMCDWNPVELICDSLVMFSNSRLSYLKSGRTYMTCLNDVFTLYTNPTVCYMPL